ncbi:phospholipase carboxylesterase [Phlyctema vagabunda]|uniref:Phospholipase carboxylesterase n=1 Tax=Phlyctema vagabunda TaxID=108571 RepID=A0ABR4PTY8_9HELO
MSYTPEDVPSDSTTIIAPLSTNHTHTVIFLHGREDFGEDLAHYFFDSTSSDGSSLAELFPSTKWVFPTAKLRYSAQRDFEFSSSSFAESLKGEEIISQWFDVWDIKAPNEKQDLMIAGLQESIKDIIQIIQEEAEIIPLERVFLGGISQGCATGIHALLYSGLQLGGFIGLSSWLPFQNIIEQIPSSPGGKNNEEISQHIKAILGVPNDTDDRSSTTSVNIATAVPRTPVFLAHSKDDETVPFAHGQGLYKSIKSLGFGTTWKEYDDGGHWINPSQGVDDISLFLRQCMGSKS